MGAHTNPLEGWPHDEPAFHPGEQAVQARFGMRERLAQVGDLIMRGAMPDEHRELLQRLPYLILGALDEAGRPWATIATGPPGFVSTPDAETVRIAAELGADDPAFAAIRSGAAVALLGIELATRRRNRANGRVLAAGDGGLSIRVEQSFGNCPKYIHPRELVAVERRPAAAVRLGAPLPASAATLVEHADTFFIATATADAGGPQRAVNGGVDVSHRGGEPGFVDLAEYDGDSVLTFPEYQGNFFFNTLGNLVVNPRAGVLFLDFDSGDVLQLSGRVEILWEGAELATFPGAQRLLKLHVEEGWWRAGAMALEVREEKEGQR